MKYLLLLILPFLAACEEHYRYPCQDPQNWGETFCKKPFCSANGKEKVGQTSPQQLQPLPQVPKKGDCK